MIKVLQYNKPQSASVFLPPPEVCFISYYCQLIIALLSEFHCALVGPINQTRVYSSWYSEVFLSVIRVTKKCDRKRSRSHRCRRWLQMLSCPCCSPTGFSGQFRRHPHCPTHDRQPGVRPQPRRHRHPHEKHRVYRAGTSQTEALVLFTVPAGTYRAAHPLPLWILP